MLVSNSQLISRLTFFLLHRGIWLYIYICWCVFHDNHIHPHILPKLKIILTGNIVQFGTSVSHDKQSINVVNILKPVKLFDLGYLDLFYIGLRIFSYNYMFPSSYDQIHNSIQHTSDVRSRGHDLKNGKRDVCQRHPYPVHRGRSPLHYKRNYENEHIASCSIRSSSCSRNFAERIFKPFRFCPDPRPREDIENYVDDQNDAVWHSYHKNVGESCLDSIQQTTGKYK